MTGFDHPEQRPRLLGAVTVILTAAAGAIDVVTFFAFNQVFASTMTGNLVLLGLGVGQQEWDQVVDNVCAIGGYCSGLIVGTLVCGVAMRRLPWRNAVGIALTVELALLIAVGTVWWGVDDASPIGQVQVIVLVVGSGARDGRPGRGDALHRSGGNARRASSRHGHQLGLEPRGAAQAVHLAVELAAADRRHRRRGGRERGDPGRGAGRRLRGPRAARRRRDRLHGDRDPREPRRAGGGGAGVRPRPPRGGPRRRAGARVRGRAGARRGRRSSGG